MSSGWVPSVTSTHGTISLKLERTDVAALLRSSLAPLIAQAKEQRIDLRIDVMADVPRFLVDREKIAWAIVTLVGNALRYVRRGTSDESGGSIIVHLVHDETRREIDITVHDDGAGVPPEKLPLLFVRRPGALHADGLALLLIRDVVGAHDGQIRVESSAGSDVHGTSITIHLPCEV